MYRSGVWNMAHEHDHPAAAPAGSRYRRDNADLLQRLRRIEGQVRGVQRMVEEDRYCVDILVQLAAVRSALGAVGRSLLEDHVRGCVVDAVRHGDGERAVTEVLDVIAQFSRQ
jgi:DNA-binding FrmR family transcriptional regulator